MNALVTLALPTLASSTGSRVMTIADGLPMGANSRRESSRNLTVETPTPSKPRSVRSERSAIFHIRTPSSPVEATKVPLGLISML